MASIACKDDVGSPRYTQLPPMRLSGKFSGNDRRRSDDERETRVVQVVAEIAKVTAVEIVRQ